MTVVQHMIKSLESIGFDLGDDLKREILSQEENQIKIAFMHGVLYDGERDPEIFIKALDDYYNKQIEK